MPEELYDDAFHPHYPSWLLVHKDSIARDEEGWAKLKEPIKWHLLRDIDDKDSVPVFTDEDTAQAFLETEGIVDDEMLAARDARELVKFLRLLEGIWHVEFVVFDPNKAVGFANRAWPIGYVIEKLQTDSGLR